MTVGQGTVGFLENHIAKGLVLRQFGLRSSFSLELRNQNLFLSQIVTNEKLK